MRRMTGLAVLFGTLVMTASGRTQAWAASATPGDGTIGAAAQESPPNTLTEEERAAGWRLLFDGKSTKGWRGFRQEDVPDGWAVEDGCLTVAGRGGDIITDDEFADFELSIDWKVEPGGNSGIIWRVDEDHGNVAWQTGPEMQVLDNERHADGKSPLTSAGSCYALFAPPKDTSRPAGEFNTARILADGAHITFWLNGEKQCEFEIGSETWNEALAKSKFATMPYFAKADKGRIALQDHGDKVWFRNIKIREIR